MEDTNIFNSQYKRMPKKKKTGGANKGKKLLQGVKQTPRGSVAARTDESAQRGTYVSAQEFERLQQVAVDGLGSARTLEEREMIASALLTIRSEIERANDTLQEEAEEANEPAPTQLDVMEEATNAVRRTSSQLSPERGTALLATMVSRIESVRSRDEVDEAQKDRLLLDVNESQSEIVRRLQQNVDLVRQQPEVSQTVRQLFSGNPETATAAPVAVARSPEGFSDKPGFFPESSDSDEEEEQEQAPVAVARSPEGFSDEPGFFPESSDSDEEEEQEQTPGQSPARVIDEDEAPAQSSEEGSVYESPIATTGLIQQGLSMFRWATTQPDAPDNLDTDVGIGQDEVTEIVEAELEEMDGDLGQDDEESIDALGNMGDRIAEKAANYTTVQQEKEIAAATLVAGHSYFANIATTTGIEMAEIQRGRMMRALDLQPASIVKRGFVLGFRRTQSESALPRTAAEATPQPGARDVDGASHPHVSTAAAQSAASAAAAGPPPVPARPLVAAIQNAVRQQMAANPPRFGSLNQDPPPIDTAERIGTVMENLQGAPLVSSLVERGLLKVSDVMDDDYVLAMEKSLRKQQVTKEVTGRDVRYRSARAAYRPPVNVTTTATPGVYKYQRPRFARPMVDGAGSA